MFQYLKLLTASCATTWLLLAAVATPLSAQESAPSPAPSTSNEARLLEGELIELAEGNPAGALEIYQSLLATAGISDPLRARTLFALGRAHRKLGELGSAKARYEELIAKFPDQVKLVRAAHRYVSEIDAGANQLPEFDWVAQVEQNPEIQAQVFEWGMQLVGTPTGKNADPTAKLAYRKLLAIGATAIPVLEPMLESTPQSSTVAKDRDAVLHGAIYVLAHCSRCFLATSEAKGQRVVS